jgi:hypothetical protein
MIGRSLVAAIGTLMWRDGTQPQPCKYRCRTLLIQVSGNTRTPEGNDRGDRFAGSWSLRVQLGVNPSGVGPPESSFNFRLTAGASRTKLSEGDIQGKEGLTYTLAAHINDAAGKFERAWKCNRQ